LPVCDGPCLQQALVAGFQAAVIVQCPAYQLRQSRIVECLPPAARNRVSGGVTVVRESIR